LNKIGFQNPKLPVLLITYSRPNNINYLLKALIQFGIRDIYISVDGPRNDKDKVNQRLIENVIKEHSKDPGIQITVLRQEINLGAAAGVLSAVDWFFSQVQMGVVLEDDLKISQDFLGFAEVALKKFQNDERVWMISGTQHFPNPVDGRSTIWANYPMVWGWASWAGKWKSMRSALLEKKSLRMRHLLDIRYIFWAIGANRALAGKVDAWDTPLALEFSTQKKLCLLPPVNLISNFGNDEMATNTRHSTRVMNEVISPLDTDTLLFEIPDELTIKSYNLLLERHIFKIKKRHILLPYHSFLLDFIRFPYSQRRIPLDKRLVKTKLNHN
jgi:hypothetical protein